MINLKQISASLHICLNGTADALLHQCHGQSKSNQPAPCHACKRRWTMCLKASPASCQTLHCMHADAPDIAREKPLSSGESSGPGKPFAKDNNRNTCRSDTQEVANLDRSIILDGASAEPAYLCAHTRPHPVNVLAQGCCGAGR